MFRIGRILWITTALLALGYTNPIVASTEATSSVSPFYTPVKEWVTDVTGDGQADRVVVYREKASGGAIRYYVYRSGNEQDLLYTSPDYLQGEVKVEQGELSISYSVYREGDANAFPSKRVTEIWSGGDVTWQKRSESEKQLVQEKDQQFVEASSNKNPPYYAIERMIEQVANEYDIPAVLLKAIAWQESSWRQFDSNGDPLISFDNGIGIMQLTNQPRFDQQRLKTDILYNLRAGAEVLLEKRAYTAKGLLPPIGGMKQTEMESWYFAIWAYNGWSVYNNPHNIPNKFRTSATYQDTVYQLARDYFAQPITRIPKQLIPREGIPSGGTTYTTPLPIHLAGEDVARRYMQSGDVAQVSRFSTTLNVRNAASISGRVVDTLQTGEIIQITAGPIEAEGYLWYKHISKDGEGWSAGHYLNALRNEKISLAELLEVEPTRLFTQELRTAYVRGQNLTLNWQEALNNGGVQQALLAQPLENLWLEWTLGSFSEERPANHAQGFLQGINLSWDQREVPLLRSLQIAFSPQVNLQEIIPDLLLLDDKGNSAQYEPLISKKTKNLLAIAPKGTWGRQKTYILYYKGLPIARFTTTDKEQVDISGYALYSEVVTDVPLSKTFEIGFTKRMDATSVKSETIWLEDDTGSKVPATVSLSADARRVYLQPKQLLVPGAYYFLKVTNGLRSEAGIPLKTQIVHIVQSEWP